MRPSELAHRCGTLRPEWLWIVVHDRHHARGAARVIGPQEVLAGWPKLGQWLVVAVLPGTPHRWAAVPVSVQAVHETLDDPAGQVIRAADEALGQLGRASGRA